MAAAMRESSGGTLAGRRGGHLPGQVELHVLCQSIRALLEFAAGAARGTGDHGEADRGPAQQPEQRHAYQ